MKKLLALLLLPAMLLAGCSKEGVAPDTAPPVVEVPQTVAEQLTNANWETKKVSESITWKYKHFEDLFSSSQSITILEIDLGNKNVQVDLPYVTSGFLKTSEGAASVRATVAINGSYFDTTKGGSTVFFKKDGQVINTTRSGFTPYRENAGFAIGADGSISIVKKPAAGWASLNDVSTLLASGPLLVYNETLVNQSQEAFNTNRHPRTAVGLTANDRLIAVVVDGRLTQAHGMTTEELATVMEALGCVEAMNLDGGGSSTAWVRNRGVVNYPSDNKKFDHEGERGVATVLAFVEN